MKILQNKQIIIIAYLIILVLSFIFLPRIDNFRIMCIIGTIISFLLLVLNTSYTKSVLTPINVIFISFILFQFGIPILYAIDPNYSNWFIRHISPQSNLIINTLYSIICIETFAFGLFISNKDKQNKNKGLKCLSDENSNHIILFSKILLVITGIVAIPLGIYVSYLALIHGYNYVKVDAMHIYNGITRFAQEFFVAANILCIIYSKNKKSKIVYMIIALIYSIILIISGSRTTSIAMILVLLFIISEGSLKNKAKKKIVIIVGILSLAVAGSLIAQQRLYGNVKKNSIIDIGESVVEEMGFNFTTINFVESFVPTYKDYQYGMTYVKSFICLIPKTLDPTKTIASINKTLPEFELGDWLKTRYGKIYNFGVGYSVIAESYYNFGYFGFFCLFIQGIIIGMMMNNRKEKCSKFSKYIEYIMMFALLTYPRRTFITLLKGIEYYIIFIILGIYVFSKIINKYRRKNYENYSNMP